MLHFHANIGTLKSAVDFLVILTVLVVAHEWGHFIAARICGMRVDDFSVFFGKRLIRLGTRNGTEYNIRSIPLGGFVMIAGMDPSDAVVEESGDIAEDAKARARANDPQAFFNKPLAQRAFVIFAGPLASILFGYLLFCTIGFTMGLPNPTVQNQVQMVLKGSPADKAGLKAGDRIISVDGQVINAADGPKLVHIIHHSVGQPLRLTISRGSQQLSIVATPYAAKVPDQVVNGQIQTVTEGRLGFVPFVVMTYQKYTPLMSIKMGTESIIQDVEGMFKTIFSKHVKEAVGGPIAIASYVSMARQQGVGMLLILGASLSISLGVINLFPIPILDGGHLLLLALEFVRKRRLSVREMQYANMFGLSVILLLMALVMVNDIQRLLAGKL